MRLRDSAKQDRIFQNYLNRPTRKNLALVVKIFHLHVWNNALRVTGHEQDAADICQDVFLGLLLRPPRSGTVRSPKGFLTSRVVTRAKNRREASTRRKIREMKAAEQLRSQQRSIDDKNDLQIVFEAIEHLPERAQMVTELRYLGGLCNREIAESLDISERTVVEELRRARELLRQRLGGGRLSALLLPYMLVDNISSSPSVAPPELLESLLKIADSGTALLPLKGVTAIGVIVMKKILVSSSLAALALFLALWAGGTFHLGTDEASKRFPRVEKSGASAAVTREVHQMEPQLPVVQESSEHLIEQAAVSDTSQNQVNVITGYVYDEKTKEGIPGVSLRAVVVSGGDTSERETFEAEAPTDSSGFYQIKGGTFEECSVICSVPDGYRELQREQRTRVVRLEKGAAVERVDFTLEKEAPLSGIVVDSDARAVEGAAVVIGGGQGIHLYKSTDSAEDGSFSFGGLPPTGDLHVQARKDDTLVSQSKALVLPEEGITGLVITVLPQSAISGTVVDPDGIPLEGIRIISTPRPANRLGGPTVVSDSAGRYSLTMFPPGKHHLILRQDGYPANMSAAGTETQIELAPGERITDLTLVYTRVHTISGQVLDPAGQPIVGARVTTENSVFGGGRPSRTDDDGSYRITDLAEGTYTVRVSSDTAKAQKVGVHADSDDVNFVLQAGHTFEIRGVVLDAETNEPIENFQVACDKIGLQTPSWESKAFLNINDSEGRFRFERTEPGRYAVVARVPGYAMNYEPIVVSESESVYQLELMLEEGGDLEGIVRNALGVPMPNVTVFFGRVDEFLTRWTTVTNEQGEFFFESFPDSKQLVSAFHPQYAISEFEVPEIARRRIPIEMSMTEGGVVKGVIKGSTGDSAVNLRVAIDLPKRHRLRRFYRTPNADGTYEFRRLPPGEANVRLDIARGRVLTRPVAVRENDVHIVDFNIPEASGAIEGIVTVNGESTRYLQVTARIATSDGEERYWTHVAPDGQYRLESVVAGTGTVTAYAGLQSGRKKELSFPIQVGRGESAIRRDFVFGE